MERVEIKESAGSLSIKMKVLAEITKEEVGMYFSYCPSLDVFSQGETRQEAKNNLIEAIRLLMDVSYERGTFAKWQKKFDKINKKFDAQAHIYKPMSIARASKSAKISSPVAYANKKIAEELVHAGKSAKTSVSAGRMAKISPVARASKSVKVPPSMLVPLKFLLSLHGLRS